MRRVHNQTVQDEETETNTEESTMTETNTDNTSTGAITDDGTETIRDFEELQYSEEVVRHYTADGRFYAYREDDEHVVVSRGWEPRDRWAKRVPAERDAVLAGERLWTIPDNWQHQVKIKDSAEASYAVYHIPESGVDVLVTVPNKTQLVDAWYKVKRVGKLTVTYDDGIAWDELNAMIEAVRDTDEVSDGVVEALEALYQHRHSFENKFAASVNMHAQEALLGRSHKPITVHQWTADPWGDIFRADTLIQDFLDMDNETRDAVLRELSKGSVLPSYPTVRVDVNGDEGIPDGYCIRALGEAGVSAAEVIDYLMTEHYDLMTPAHWAEIRGTEVSNINKNVTCAKKKLSD